MGNKKKVKIKVVIVKKPPVNIPIVKKHHEDVESDEEIHRERQGEICDGCLKKKDTEKVDKKFLCKDCREELREDG